MGPQSCGKSSIIDRLCHDRFSLTIAPTIGHDMSLLSLPEIGDDIKLYVVDLNTSDKFILPVLYKQQSASCDVVMIAVDISNSCFSEEISKYTNYISPKDKPVIIIGTKSDLAQVCYEDFISEGLNCLNGLSNYHFLLCSSKTSDGIVSLRRILISILRDIPLESNLETQNAPEPQNTKDSKQCDVQ